MEKPALNMRERKQRLFVKYAKNSTVLPVLKKAAVILIDKPIFNKNKLTLTALSRFHLFKI